MENDYGIGNYYGKLQWHLEVLLGLLRGDGEVALDARVHAGRLGVERGRDA